MFDRPIVGLALWLSKPVGFLATCFTVTVGLGAGAILSFNDHWALVFNLFLSIAAMLLTTEALVVEKKEQEPEAAHSHGHGHSHHGHTH